MPITKQISDQLTEAMKARDTARTSALRMLRAALLETEKSGKGPLTDEMAIQVIQRVKKQRQEAADLYLHAGRKEQAEAELAEIRIADEFLPRCADEEQTHAWVREAIAATGATSRKELGKVMGALMKAHKAELDASVARAMLEKELGD